MTRPSDQQANAQGAAPLWTWPPDDQIPVDITRYYITRYPHKGLSAWIGAARLVGDTWEEWQKRRAAPIQYLLKVADEAVSERLYYRLARTLDLPQQHVFWAVNPLRAGLIGVAIQFEREAFFPGDIDVRANTVTYRRKTSPVANAADFWRHGVLHSYCGTGDIHQAMVKGKVLFGIDAADCMFRAPLFEGYWRDYLAHYRQHEPARVPVILAMMGRIAGHPELPDLIEQELVEAPGPVFDIPFRRLPGHSTIETLVGYDRRPEEAKMGAWAFPAGRQEHRA